MRLFVCRQQRMVGPRGAACRAVNLAKLDSPAGFVARHTIRGRLQLFLHRSELKRIGVE
jgi:hypothetical protein